MSSQCTFVSHIVIFIIGHIHVKYIQEHNVCITMSHVNEK